MGYGFMAWAVDTEKLRQVAGSKDAELCQKLTTQYARRLAELDRRFGTAPSAAEALRHIIDGTVPVGGSNPLWFYVFQLVVEHFGRSLKNAAVYPWNRLEFGAIDAALKTAGVPLSMMAFVGRDLPVTLPLPVDFPMVEWLDASKVEQIHRAFEASRDPVTDPHTKRVFDCLRDWFRVAAEAKVGLVSYYY